MEAAMEIGVSSYSFGRLVKSGAIKQIDIPAKAKEMGFDTIEFSVISVPEGENLKDFAGKLKGECERAGFKIANYTIGADFINGSEGDIDAEIERVKREADVAKILGAPGMRHDATSGFPADKPGAKSFDDALPRLVNGCRAVAEYAESLGLKTMIENHGYFCQDAERLEKLVCGVDRGNFGVLLDIGNFIVADEDPVKAAGLLMPYTFHVHAKDFHIKPGSGADPGRGWNLSRGGNFWRGSIIGHGNVPVVQCLRVMKRSGYDGVLSIEFEGMEDVLTGIEISRENLVEYVKNVYG